MHDFYFSGRRILLTDDVSINLEIAKRYLEKFGFEVDCACNGMAALELFTTAESGTYSAIIMDIRMPIMDGYEAAKKIRASSHSDAHTIPIIALSADAMPHDVEKALSCGMNVHIAKPFSGKNLYETLYRLISESE